MEKACDESAARLRRPVDIGQIHWSTANYFPWQESRSSQRVLWESLVSLYKSGRCRAVGVSNYGPQQLRKIHAFLQENGDFRHLLM
eukprot:748795-Hanusia_phi.AAC.4